MTHAEMVDQVVKLHEWVKHWSQRADAAEKALAEAQREINALWGDGGRKLLAEAAEDTTLLDKAQRIGIAINGYGHGGLYDKSSVRAAIRAVREKV
tara:strand:- start:1799 stop:2086 length:288 start_codon:yes stop_codon:yes gene_type:complete